MLSQLKLEEKAGVSSEEPAEGALPAVLEAKTPRPYRAAGWHGDP